MKMLVKQDEKGRDIEKTRHKSVTRKEFHAENRGQEVWWLHNVRNRNPKREDDQTNGEEV